MAHWQHCPGFLDFLSRLTGTGVVGRLAIQDKLRQPDLDPELVREYKIEERWIAWLEGRYSQISEDGWLRARETTVWELLDRGPSLAPVELTELGHGSVAREVSGIYQFHAECDLWLMNAQTMGWLRRTYRDRMSLETKSRLLKTGYMGNFRFRDGDLRVTEMWVHRQVPMNEILGYRRRGGEPFRRIIGVPDV